MKCFLCNEPVRSQLFLAGIIETYFIHAPLGGQQAKLRLLIDVSSLTIDLIRHRLIHLASDILGKDGQGDLGKLF